MERIEIDRTDEEREELVKKWISDNWLWVVAVVGIAIAGVFGLNYYKQSKINALNNLAVQLTTVEQQLANNQPDVAAKTVASLQQNHQSSSFAAIATLSLAKNYFIANDYDKAAKQYSWLAANAGERAMRDIARLRQARTLANANKIDEAVAVLAAIEDKNSIPEANLLKGDILLAANQFDQAKLAYESLKNGELVNAAVIEQRMNLLDIKQEQSQ